MSVVSLRRLQKASRRALVNLTLSGTFLFPMETPLSVKLCTEHGDTESDSLCAALKLSFKQHPELVQTHVH